MKYLLAVLVGSVLGWLSLMQGELPSCRCRPWEACWPSEDTWRELNASIAGNLVRLRPIADVCHGPAFNQSACAERRRWSLDSGWRAAQPGALQNWVWESGSHVNETCHLTAPREAPCHQGRIPLYSAAVDSVEQVQRAVVFARKHNLRLTILNTGHDGAGHSSGPDSFQIHTHGLQGIQYHDDFQPDGSTTPLGSAVTVGAGVQLRDLYRGGSQEGYAVVGGECPTVGAAGGFLQGGGVSSFMSHTWGLAVDNVLQFEMVTAQGDRVIANADQNPDLFWALRGGGGGTFGVVTRATIRTYPDMPVVIATLTVAVDNVDATFWTTGVTILLAALQEFNRENVAGQFSLKRLSGSGMEASLMMYFLNNTETARINGRLSMVQTTLGTAGMMATFSSKFLPRLTMAFPMSPDIYPENHGVVMGSVLVSNQMFTSSDGPRRMADRLSSLPMGPRDRLFTSNLGGRVMAQRDTAMHPAWRSAAHLVNFVRVVEPSVAGKLAALDGLAHIQMPVLYSLDPKAKVSYLNVADPSEKDPDVFWGGNYDRLLQIKRGWDLDDLFLTKLGVGSEAWEMDGMCRKRRSLLGQAVDSTSGRAQEALGRVFGASLEDI
ncbi:chanoclavine-I synthase oxidoreductase protein [Aspergillus bertholletiae]|uniref:Chanoclavine-I synthase oxidoreductase protein n=1 Tax=Aspergillus bertholletiae TaxID=1226010 RepID=A0A5N7BJ42_9EURO|nr:chanoclavine-I synthase oxidoreductase protein [Aspergillus bertholletiae]